MKTQFKMPVPSNRVVRLAWYLAGVIAVLVLAGTVVALIQLSTGYESLDEQSTDQRETLRTVIDTTEELDEALKKANRRLRENDLPAVTSPPVDPEIIEGATGATGAAGDTGATGAVGPTGATGPRGFAGPPGPTGAPGPVGATGETGAKGDRGEPGADGKNGSDGSDGTDGTNGVDGDTGAKGDTGETGAPGATGAPGRDGSDGADGTDGVDGTDAVPFTFLFTIPADETLPDVSPAQTYSCVIPEPGGPFTCELVPA